MANATSAGGQPRFISTAPPPSGSPPSSQTADRQRDLPHELLVQIIQYAAPPLATIPKDQRRRRRPLRRCALVNKAWHAAALDEAVQHLFINLHEGGWSQSEEEATKRIKALKERAADRGRNVKTLALFGEKALPTPSADALRNSFDQVTQMSLTKMKKPLRLLGGMQNLVILRLYDIQTPVFCGNYPSLKRFELIDSRVDAFLPSWSHERFPRVETAVFQPKWPVYGEQLAITPPVDPPHTLRALAIAGGFRPWLSLALEWQPKLEHLHVGTTSNEASSFLSLCTAPSRSLSFDASAAETMDLPVGVPLPSWQVLASAPRFDQITRLDLYSDRAPRADEWFGAFWHVFDSSQQALGADFVKRSTAAKLNLSEWDPLHGRIGLEGL
ncbi:hypothetical protein BMF94_0197 [Rhodotorula taiwanensis]|uniref:F-box domain-containing protein n=1 Tax=Rhodotorula taiwanensis TaxID=741276 RepID=A0A2S5BIL0_9BASI|nr:hypothetical protein BMF94_0197 [Rhodotorula taiwanensis]